MSFTKEFLRSVLTKTFGFSDFRPGQYEAVSTLLHDSRLLCIHPTGFGKSLLYQLPAVLLEGITVVISPLLALMRDQQVQLNERFKIPAAAINTDQSYEENGWARMRAQKGELKILFVAPEQLDNLDSVEFLHQLPISLVVVDEAHCISTWGHDFRPSYRQILNFIRKAEANKPSLKILGLTATADAKAEEDIRRQLSGGQQPLKVLRESMNRPNISLSVFPVRQSARKLHACLQFVHQLEGCGLIYCATRENTELVAAYLKSQGVNVAAYHAGFESDQKRALQTEFIQDKYKAIVATNALGMGIDKSNLRFIIHYDLPGSITAYYQEVGRCGRDGQQAYEVTLYDPEDKKIQEYFIESAQPNADDFKRVIHAIETSVNPPNLTLVKRMTGLHPTRVVTVLAELMEQAFITKVKEQNLQIYRRTAKKGSPDLSRYTTQFAVKMRELRSMIKYAEHKEICLMEYLRKALGDQTTARCGHCYNCKPNSLCYTENKKEIEAIDQWLNAKAVEIGGFRIPVLSKGIALMDGKQRSSRFVEFMHKRAQSHATDCGLSDELLSMLKLQINKLAKTQRFSAIVPIPSRTWGGRNAICQMLGKYLSIPVIFDLLEWEELPPSRQGFLLNNDQRTQNVRNRMRCEKKLSNPQQRRHSFI